MTMPDHPRSGRIAGWFVLALLWGGDAAAAADAAAPVFAGPDTCAACHPSEYEEWKTSRHAGALSPTFRTFWHERGERPECLACHTTGFDVDRKTYAFPGVSCEACHGALAPDHPDAPSMALPTDASACMSCHRQTYLEWQLSGHAKRDIRCFDCHRAHGQGLRQADPEQQCGACHAQRLEDFAHATHHFQHLTCTTCHMPAPRSPGIGGTGAPSHSFFVGAETCAACHEEMVHTSHKLGTLTQEVERLSQISTVQHAERLQADVRQLQLEVDIERARRVKTALAMLGLGLTLGVGVMSGWRRNGRRPPGGTA